MKNTLLMCVLWATLGMASAGWLTAASPAFGQELTQPQAFLNPPGPAAPAAVPAGAPAAAPQQTPVEDELTPEERVNIAVYENCNRSVVNITTESVSGDRLLFFEIPSKGEGSGSVISRDGHILTNYHVVDGAREIEVHLWDGKSYPGRLIGGDPASDVAVIKVDAPETSLLPIPLGDSTRLRVGQKVYAIGNPFGLERTLSTGIISSLNRTLPGRRTNRSLRQMIQIDAAINPGNSGGPLLDSHGRLIGMNTAIASGTGQSAGVGFSIPVSTIARVVPQLLRSGRVTRPEVGIAKVYQTEQGLLIAALAPGGPAEKAGLRGPRVVTQRKRQGPFVYEYQTVDKSAADLVVAIDGKPTKTADEFLTQIESKQPGSQVVITVVRAGRQLDVPVVLSASE